MKKLFPIFLLIFLLPVLASAQNGYFIWRYGDLNSTLIPELASAQNGYLVTDSTRIGMKNLFDGGDVFNAQYCKVWEFDGYTVYTPYEIKEYGFSDGRVYVSSEIQFEDTIKRVFLERLSEGKNTIYYYIRKRAETYFFEKDSASLIKIAKRDINGISYRNQLLEVTLPWRASSYT